MTATQTILARKSDDELIYHTYVSYHPPTGGYVLTLMSSDSVAHFHATTPEGCHEQVSETLRQLGVEVLQMSPGSRTRIRAERWDGNLHLVHEEEACYLPDQSARRAIATARDDIRRFVRDVLAVEAPAYAPLLTRWTSDVTIGWELVADDLAKLIDEPSLELHRAEGPSAPRANIRIASELPFGHGPAVRCPVCGVGIAPSGINEPFAIDAQGRVLCRRDGVRENPDYPRILAEYWDWRAQRAHAFEALRRKP